MVEPGRDESDGTQEASRTILIVDDSPMSLRLLTHMVTLHGYGAQAMVNPQDALAYACASPPDLVLLDIMMPEMNGFEFAERFKADERTRDIPIIFISALNDETSKVKAFTSGGVDYVSKPLHVNEVIARVETHIRLREATQRLQRQIVERERLIVELDMVNEQLKEEIKEREAAQAAREASLQLLRRVLAKTEALYRITRSLITSEDVPDMLQMVSDSVAQLLPADYVLTVTMDQSGSAITAMYASGAKLTDAAVPSYDDLMDGLMGWAVKRLQPVISLKGQPDPRESPRARERREAAQSGSILVVPLYFQGRMMGAVMAIGHRDAPDYDEQDLAQLTAIAGQTSVALANAWLSDETAHLKEFNEGIVQGVAEAILLLDHDHCITFANPAVAPMVGHSPEDLVGSSYMALLPVDQHNIVSRGIASSTGGSAARLETELLNEAGQRVPVLASIRPLYKEERVVGSLVALTDITEIKQAEEQLRRYASDLETQNEELAAFAHTVAHDLRSPLTGLMGYADLLEMTLGESLRTTGGASKSMDYVHYLKASSAKMNNIIDELLLLASVREVDEVDVRGLDMARIVREAQTRLDYLIVEHHAEVHVALAWPQALGYGPWIEEVWVNYLSNAVKYGGRPDEGIPPIIHLGFDAETGNGHIRYWVQDNGTGLTPAQMSQLFTPFERLRNVRAEGHGLGLSIVRRILEKLGGSVGVTSELGVGSSFYFDLPRA